MPTYHTLATTKEKVENKRNHKQFDTQNTTIAQQLHLLYISEELIMTINYVFPDTRCYNAWFTSKTSSLKIEVNLSSHTPLNVYTSQSAGPCFSKQLSSLNSWHTVLADCTGQLNLAELPWRTRIAAAFYGVRWLLYFHHLPRTMPYQLSHQQETVVRLTKTNYERVLTTNQKLLPLGSESFKNVSRVLCRCARLRNDLT